MFGGEEWKQWGMIISVSAKYTGERTLLRLSEGVINQAPTRIPLPVGA